MLNVIYIYISFVTILLGCSAFFDKIATKNLKHIIINVIIDRTPIRFDLESYLRFFIHSTIVRIFGTKYSTSERIFRSFIISFGFFLVVLIAYSIKNQVNPISVLSIGASSSIYVSVICAATIVVSVIVGDAFSIIQTTLLLQLVKNVRTTADIFILMASDLVITINIFVFVLPVGLQICFVICDVYGFNAEVLIQRAEDASIVSINNLDSDKLRQYGIENNLKSYSLISTIMINDMYKEKDYTPSSDLKIVANFSFKGAARKRGVPGIHASESATSKRLQAIRRPTALHLPPRHGFL